MKRIKREKLIEAFNRIMIRRGLNIKQLSEYLGINLDRLNGLLYHKLPTVNVKTIIDIIATSQANLLFSEKDRITLFKLVYENINKNERISLYQQTSQNSKKSGGKRTH